jgi:hypothetical protein
MKYKIVAINTLLICSIISILSPLCARTVTIELTNLHDSRVIVTAMAKSVHGVTWEIPSTAPDSAINVIFPDALDQIKLWSMEPGNCVTFQSNSFNPGDIFTLSVKLAGIPSRTAEDEFIHPIDLTLFARSFPASEHPSSETDVIKVLIGLPPKEGRTEIQWSWTWQIHSPGSSDLIAPKTDYGIIPEVYRYKPLHAGKSI